MSTKLMSETHEDVCLKSGQKLRVNDWATDCNKYEDSRVTTADSAITSKRSFTGRLLDKLTSSLKNK